MSYLFCEAYTIFWWEVKRYLTRKASKFLYNSRRRNSTYVVYFMYLIEFVISWKQRKQAEYLKKHTTNSPNVHFVVVKSIC